MTEQQESQVKPQPTAVVNGSKNRSGAALAVNRADPATHTTGLLYMLK